MKKLFFLFAVIIPQFVLSQDVIVKRNGDTILSKVIKVTKNEIEYKKFSNIDGPIYGIETSEIIATNYENGTKDTFNNNETLAITEKIDEPERREVIPVVTAHNSELIALYNNTHYELEKHITGNKAKYGLCIYGITPGSILSNEDLEVAFVRKGRTYDLTLINKSNKPIVIDKGNTFKVDGLGKYEMFYDETEIITKTNGSNSGATIGLGGIANVLGIGGILGTLANSVSVGGGSSSSITKTHLPQRFLSIPPSGKAVLHNEIFMGL